MSQYPPPGGPPMYPPNMPPGGPGGFGPPGYSLPPQSRTSAVAIVSLVCGLLSFCIPLITSAIAVITGIIGIVQTGHPAVKGRGMAIAGLILGLLSIAGWGVFGLAAYRVFQKSGPERIFAQQYVTDLAAGKVDQCVQNSTANIVPDQLKADAAQAQNWGTLQQAIAIPQNFNYNNGASNITFTGVTTFSNGNHKFMITVVKDSSGSKVDSFQWMP
jgi:hypothetical protein